MTVREFINHIIDGSFTKNDVLLQSEKYPDKDDLHFQLKVAQTFTKSDTEYDRLDFAMGWLCEQYPTLISWPYEGVDNDVDPIKHQEEAQIPQIQALDPLEPMHQVNVPTESKKPAKERILDAISNKTGIFKYKAVSESVLAAIDQKLISFTDTGLKWKRSNVLLAYFFGRLICGDTIKEGAMDQKMYYIVGGYGSEPFPEKELEDLFGVTSLRQARNNRSGRAAPKGYKEIEKYIRS